MSIKSDLTISSWNDLKRLPTRFNEVSIHLRKLSSVLEDEMTGGNQYCDSNLLQLFLNLIESIDDYHYYRKTNSTRSLKPHMGCYIKSSNPERDEELTEKWEKIKGIRTFPKGLPYDNPFETFDTIRFNYDEIRSVISQICEELRCEDIEESVSIIEGEIKSEVTIKYWDYLKRLPTRFNEVSIHLRKLSSVLEDEMTGGNQSFDYNLLQLFLNLIEEIDYYHYYRKSEKTGSSDRKRDEELTEKWERIKSIRSFPKGLTQHPITGEKLDSMSFVEHGGEGEKPVMSKIVNIQRDLYWDFPDDEMIKLDWESFDDHKEKWGVGKDTYWVLDPDLGKWEKTTKEEYKEKYMNPKTRKLSNTLVMGVMV